jgi:hypothetical protein
VAHVSSSATVATAKFVLHAGLAVGALYEFIYKPFKAGTLKGFTHKLNLAKAVLAGIFGYHELKLAISDGQGSPVVSKLLSPINALASALSGIGSQLKSGNINSGAITSAQTQATNLVADAKKDGASIPSSVPGLSLLTQLG